MTGILHNWGHSLAGTLAGGHFHLTGGLIALIAVILVAAILVRRSRQPDEGSAANAAAAVVTAAAICVTCAVLVLHRHAHPAVTPAPKPTIIRTTVVQHVASHPMLNGWQIAAIAIVAMVVGLVTVLNLKNR